jgi:hypothetical protein
MWVAKCLEVVHTMRYSGLRYDGLGGPHQSTAVHKLRTEARDVTTYTMQITHHNLSFRPHVKACATHFFAPDCGLGSND